MEQLGCGQGAKNAPVVQLPPVPTRVIHGAPQPPNKQSHQPCTPPHFRPQQNQPTGNVIRDQRKKNSYPVYARTELPSSRNPLAVRAQHVKLVLKKKALIDVSSTRALVVAQITLAPLSVFGLYDPAQSPRATIIHQRLARRKQREVPNIHSATQGRVCDLGVQSRGEVSRLESC